MKGTVPERILDLYRKHSDVAARFFDSSAPQVAAVADLCINALRACRKILLFGNGGSAADAQHLAAELVNRFSDCRRALPAVALTTDASILTSVANDDDFSRVFARQVEALGHAGDVAVGLSTSGRSRNVLDALSVAKEMSLVTVGFTGAEVGEMAKLCRCIISVPTSDTPRVQEIHLLVGHIICQLVDDAFMTADA